jgi:hypothetical protein
MIELILGGFMLASLGVSIGIAVWAGRSQERARRARREADASRAFSDRRLAASLKRLRARADRRRGLRD